MKPNFERLERSRETKGPYASKPGDYHGLFLLWRTEARLLVLSSGISEWEHVSVSIKGKSRTPTWEEMCFVKGLFWGEDETVIQFHPPKSEYINNHKYCLHLWKPQSQIELPPSILVGIKGIEL